MKAPPRATKRRPSARRTALQRRSALGENAIWRSRQRNRWRWLWVPFISAWAACFGLLAIMPYVGLGGLVVLTVLAVPYHRYFGRKLLGRHARIERDDGDLVVLAEDDSTIAVIPVARIASGFYNDVDRVVLELDDGTDYYLAVADRQSAETLMDDAAVTVELRAMRVPVAGPLAQGIAAPIFGCVGLLVALVTSIVVGLKAIGAVSSWLSSVIGFGAMVSAAGYALGWLLICFVLIRLLQRREAIVGSDGVLLQRPLWSNRFIAYTEIAQVCDEERRITLVTHAGRRHRLAARWSDPFSPQVSRKDQVWANDALYYRLQQAVAHRHLSSAGISLDQLDRHGRDGDRWHEALKRIAATAGGYRDPAVLRHSLAIVVADPNQTPERRVGAALALAEAGQQARDDVAAAADACADPQLAHALRAASEQRVDLAALEHANRRQIIDAEPQRVRFDGEDLERYHDVELEAERHHDAELEAALTAHPEEAQR